MPGLEGAIPYIGGGLTLLSTLGGIFGSKKSPQEQSMEEMMGLLKQYLPNMEKMAFSKEEISTLVKSMQSMYRGGANVAAGNIGAAIGESGATPGQGFAEMYTQALAPVIAEGENKAAGAEAWGEQAYSNEFNQAKGRVSNMLGTMSQVASMQPSMTADQKGISGFLKTLQLLSTGTGNLANAWKDFNYKPPTGSPN